MNNEVFSQEAQDHNPVMKAYPRVEDYELYQFFNSTEDTITQYINEILEV